MEREQAAFQNIGSTLQFFTAMLAIPHHFSKHTDYFPGSKVSTVSINGGRKAWRPGLQEELILLHGALDATPYPFPDGRTEQKYGPPRDQELTDLHWKAQ